MVLSVNIVPAQCIFVVLTKRLSKKWRADVVARRSATASIGGQYSSGPGLRDQAAVDSRHCMSMHNQNNGLTDV